jgi:DNA repair protein RadC
MTQAQKTAKDKFKKAIAYRTKTGVSLKEAFAHIYGKKVSAVKKKAAPKKKASAKKITGNKKVGEVKKKNAIKKKFILKKINNYRQSNAKLPSEFVSLSGYSYGKEIIVAGIGKLSTLKNLVPDVKLRVTRGKKSVSDIVTSGSVASEIFKRFIGKNKIETQELVAVAYLSQSNKVLGVYVHTIGSISAANVDVRLILAGALQMGAVSLILCHNHPSGNLKPSDADKTITKQLVKAADYHSILVLDHIIITKESYFSFAENGLL